MGMFDALLTATYTVQRRKQGSHYITIDPQHVKKLHLTKGYLVEIAFLKVLSDTPVPIEGKDED